MATSGATPPGAGTGQPCMFKQTDSEEFMTRVFGRIPAAADLDESPAVLRLLGAFTGIPLLLLPAAVARAGVALGAAVLLGVALLSYAASTYLLEVLSLHSFERLEEAVDAVVRAESKKGFDKDLQDALLSQYRMPECRPRRAGMTYRDLKRFRMVALEEEESPLCKRLRRMEGTHKQMRNAKNEMARQAFASEIAEKHPERVFHASHTLHLAPLASRFLSEPAKRAVLALVFAVSAGTLVIQFSMAAASLEKLLRLAARALELPWSGCREGCLLAGLAAALGLCLQGEERRRGLARALQSLRLPLLVLLLGANSVSAYHRLEAAGSITALFGELPGWRPSGLPDMLGVTSLLFVPVSLRPQLLAQPHAVGYGGARAALTAAVILAAGFCGLQLALRDGTELEAIPALKDMTVTRAAQLVGVICAHAIAILELSSVPTGLLSLQSSLAGIFGDSQMKLDRLYDGMTTLGILVPLCLVAFVAADALIMLRVLGCFGSLVVIWICPLYVLQQARLKLWRVEALDECMERPLKSKLTDPAVCSCIVVVHVLVLICVGQHLMRSFL